MAAQRRIPHQGLRNDRSSADADSNTDRYTNRHQHPKPNSNSHQHSYTHTDHNPRAHCMGNMLKELDDRSEQSGFNQFKTV